MVLNMGVHIDDLITVMLHNFLNLTQKTTELMTNFSRS